MEEYSWFYIFAIIVNNVCAIQKFVKTNMVYKKQYKKTKKKKKKNYTFPLEYHQTTFILYICGPDWNTVTCYKKKPQKRITWIWCTL